MSALLSFIGWSFLPSMVTGWILSFWYRFITRAGDPIPQRGTPRWVRDYKRINISVIGAYLLYTIYESYHGIIHTPNFYAFMRSNIDVDERTLKSKFRRLTVLYHPDKVGLGGEEQFVMLKLAYDVLSDPVKRFAYDRFGPDMLDWKHCSSMYDYLVRGGTVMLPYYVGSLLFLVILSVLGKAEFGRYWRFFTFFCLITFETAVVTRPAFPSLPFFAPLLPFEQLILARKIAFTTFIAISQLAPLFQSQRNTGPPTVESMRPQLERLFGFTKLADTEASNLLALDFLPHESDVDTVRDIQTKMKSWLVENTVRNDPEVRDAVGNVLKKRRTGVPSGAKGNR
ncbi:uncharacterized protein H6S33_002196 [Morchella sextelata]|uniref:uncharacterized protein n=1 Tax=Morchella sextelata TaxID=1174677 RepID=UPI001D057FD8|nr:uncharacterized protein H6S33_002196 [Morchella sextelata]KAH0608144.1 hypothetical protein H6S33_002196 [Morchella sextelata]